MTGGGFGGCTVTLVERGAVKALEEALRGRYRKELKLSCDCYECLPAAGAGVLDLTPHVTPAGEGGAGAEGRRRSQWAEQWERYSSTILIGTAVVAVAVGAAILLRRTK